MEPILDVKNGSHLYSATTGTKSRFRNLFVRKKTSSDEQGSLEIESRPSSSAASVIETFSSKHVTDPDSLSEDRDRITETVVSEARYASGRSKSRSRRRSPSSPPAPNAFLPLSQACAQANFHSTMQVPSLQIEDGPSPIINFQPAPLTQDESPNGSKTSQYGCSMSSPQRCKLISNLPICPSKLFCLFENGMILQYASSGSDDRMPEACFCIALDTIVSTKEIVPQSSWMLELRLLKETPSDTKSGSSRSTWARLSFRSSETRDAILDLIVIFHDKSLMSTWLNAIRSKIDTLVRHNNEAESHTDRIRPKAPSARPSSGERSSSRPAFLRFSKSSSNLRNELGTLAVSDKELPRPLVPSYVTAKKSSSSRSIAASSVNTMTSLDGLRDSDTGSTTTTTTNSLDGSIALESPIKATFASISSPIMSIESRFSPVIGQNEFRDPLIKQMSREQQIANIPQAGVRASTSSNTIILEAPSSDTVGQEPAILVSSPEGEGEVEASQQDASDLTSSRTRYPERRSSLLPSQPINTEILSEETEDNYASNGHVRNTTKSSIDSHSKPVYSLFPKRMVHEVKVEPLMPMEASRIPGLPSISAVGHFERSPSPSVAPKSSLSSGSKLVLGKRPSPLQLLSPALVEQPQRSPAVTDDMLASNFGTLPSALYHTEPSPQKFDVPNLADLCQLLEVSRNTSGRRESPERAPSTSPNRKSRSIPNLQAATRAPMGPPPQRPLPAIPPNEATAGRSRGHSRTKRTSEKLSRQASLDVSPVLDGHSIASPFDPLVLINSKHEHAERRTNKPVTSERTTPRTSPVRAPKDSFGIPAVVSTLVPQRNSSAKYQHDLWTSKSFCGHRRAKSGSGRSLTASVGSISSFDSILGTIR